MTKGTMTKPFERLQIEQLWSCHHSQVLSSLSSCAWSLPPRLLTVVHHRFLPSVISIAGTILCVEHP